MQLKKTQVSQEGNFISQIPAGPQPSQVTSDIKPKKGALKVDLFNGNSVNLPEVPSHPIVTDFKRPSTFETVPEEEKTSTEEQVSIVQVHSPKNSVANTVVGTGTQIKKEDSLMRGEEVPLQYSGSLDILKMTPSLIATTTESLGRENVIEQDQNVVMAYPVASMATVATVEAIPEQGSFEYPFVRLSSNMKGATILRDPEGNVNGKTKFLEPSAPTMDAESLEPAVRPRTRSQEFRDSKQKAIQTQLDAMIATYNDDYNAAYQKAIDLCERGFPEHEAILYYNQAGEIFKEAISCLQKNEKMKAAILHFKGKFTLELGKDKELPKFFHYKIKQYSHRVFVSELVQQGISYCNTVLALPPDSLTDGCIICLKHSFSIVTEISEDFKKYVEKRAIADIPDSILPIYDEAGECKGDVRYKMFVASPLTQGSVENIFYPIKRELNRIHQLNEKKREEEKKQGESTCVIS